MTSFHFLKNFQEKKKLFYLEFVSAGIGGKGTNEMQYVLNRKAKATKTFLFLHSNSTILYIQIWFINRCGFNILLYVNCEIQVLLVYYYLFIIILTLTLKEQQYGFVALARLGSDSSPCIYFLWPCIIYFWSTLNLMCTVIINVP